MLSVHASSLNSVSNSLTQNISINLPAKEEMEEADKDLDRTIGTSSSDQDLESRVENFLLEQSLDRIFALEKLRMDLEKELRRILRKRIDTSDPTQMKGRFIPARSLFREFVKLHLDYSGLHSSFRYILQICNAAIHGQRISASHADKALHMGFKILDALRKIDEKSP